MICGVVMNVRTSQFQIGGVINMTCDYLTQYKGKKAEKVQQMINEKFLKIKQDNFDKVIKKTKKELKPFFDDYNKAKQKYNLAKVIFDNKCKDFGVYYIDYIDEYRLKSECHVPKKDFAELDKANKLFAIGKNKEGNEILSKLIEKHELI